VSLLDFALGDRAGTFLLASCLLIIALAIISAIVDIPLRSLTEAGYSPRHILPPPLSTTLILGLCLGTLIFSFAGAAIQAYLASSPYVDQQNALALWGVTNVAFFVGIIIWGICGPLNRHWGLCLGSFGLGVATLFLLLAAVLQLPFTATGTLVSDPARLMFSGLAGAILVALGACLASILALAARVAAGVFTLIEEHQRRQHRLISDWNVGRRIMFRRFRAHEGVQNNPDDLSE
jgi:hypothetical protein